MRRAAAAFGLDVRPLRSRYVEILGDALKIEPSPTDYLAVKRALEKGMTIEADSAADTFVPLKRLITRARGTRSS